MHRSRRHPHEHRLPQLPRHRHHRVLRNAGKLEIALQMANHKSARTTNLYDRQTDQINQYEVERIMI